MLRKSRNKPLKKTPWATPKKCIPRWVKSIPQSTAHGSGQLQKRLWRLTSDYVRIRDYYKFGVCVATNVKMSDWRVFQAGHWISYSVCRGLFKFDVRNIHAQSAISNKLGTREVWQSYEAELIRRYGVQYLNELEDENKKSSLKFTNEQVIEKMAQLVLAFKKLPEYPDYLDRVIPLIEYEQLQSQTR